MSEMRLSVRAGAGGVTSASNGESNGEVGDIGLVGGLEWVLIIFGEARRDLEMFEARLDCFWPIVTQWVCASWVSVSISILNFVSRNKG